MSSFSAIAAATIPYIPPEAPSELEAPTMVISYVGFELTWSDNANNEQGFILQRKSGSAAWSQIAVLPVNCTIYEENLAQVGTHYYRIKSFNRLGFSSYSNQITVMVEDW